ncbi:hypothetical protein [Pelagicoccus sp. SDUM812003]|uniref:hypothetical protein n=1 Tax=Pelagicoccus sp. SDUM812003 TaxID=3041267 RepID=UPI00280F0152|nr:hypothetical protein [Pelagicoccus sp. SDUM812003]MDQ8202725.1 hypothetical protein [Pelagicoccus sp. SDUM812003]
MMIKKLKTFPSFSDSVRMARWKLSPVFVILSLFAGAANGSEMSSSLKSYEFNGILRIGDRAQFCIHDRVGGGHFWLGLKEARAGLTLLEWDAETESILIELNGSKGRLAFKEERVTPLKIRKQLTAAMSAEKKEELREQRQLEESQGLDLAVGYQLIKQRKRP